MSFVESPKMPWRWLFAFCIGLFGICLAGGRPLTMHEAVLPQTAREMLADHDWLIPKSGGRPWLENPPLPQWITVAFAVAAGNCDSEWVVRLGSVLAATVAVWATARIGTRLYSAQIGILSGLILATMFQFLRYAWLAEDEIYLCMMVTLSMWAFVECAFSTGNGASATLWSGRPSCVWAFFLLMGGTNLTKGLGFGNVLVAAPTILFLLGQRRWTAFRPFLWPLGWLLYVFVAAAWYVAAGSRYPGAWELWWYDLGGRMSGEYTAINQPVWYYLPALLWTMAPWTPLVAAGLFHAARPAWRESSGRERFLFCWAIAPVSVLTLAHGKHHHYLLQCLMPFAIVGAVGMVALREPLLRMARRMFSQEAWRIGVPILASLALIALVLPVPGKLWLVPAMAGLVAGVHFGMRSMGKDARGVAGTAFVTVAVAYVIGFVYTGKYVDQCRHDTQFLRAIGQADRPGPLLVHGGEEALDAFRLLFYLPASTRYLHDLTFLRDERLTDPVVWVLCRRRDGAGLAELGDVAIEAESQRTRREKSPEDRLALFRLRFDPALERYRADGVLVSPMQAMARAPGPTLGPPLGWNQAQSARSSQLR